MAFTLEWDKTATRDFESGISMVALFPIDSNGASEDGEAWSGVTAINESPSGADATDLYADDIKYATLRSAEKFGFSIEAYDYPEAWAECDGSKEVATGVYLGQQSRKAFHLAYKTKIGDDTHPGLDKGYKIHLIYNSTASPSGRNYATINENPDAISMSWEANSTPVMVSMKDSNNNAYQAVSTIVIDSTKFDTQELKANLAAFEAYLYGDGTKKAKMPTPEIAVKLLNGTYDPQG